MNMNRALCHFFPSLIVISTVNEYKSYVQLFVINKYSSILENRLFLSLSQRLFLIRINFRTFHCRLSSNVIIDFFSFSNFKRIIKNHIIVIEKFRARISHFRNVI